jgi:hypothetical protein
MTRMVSRTDTAGSHVVHEGECPVHVPGGLAPVQRSAITGVALIAHLAVPQKSLPARRSRDA